jgi:endonuclease/exonuclease/phosphatase family metal-dependent hydrolase
MTSPQMTSLRVLGYNVHSLRDDPRALAAVVREVAPDVAILQEAPRRFRWRQKCANLARSFDLVVAGGGLPALGNLILTSLRVRARESWCVRFPLTPGRHLRGAVLLRCTVGRTTFVAAGSHLSIDPDERPSQATTLKKYLSEVDEPLVFGGDLNENSGGAAWRTLADGLVDAAVAAGAQERATFPGLAPTDRIDGVFVDPRWTVVGYDVVDTPAARSASDHLPLVVDLALP